MLMTLKVANELDILRGKWKKYFEKYSQDSQKIQSELEDENAPQYAYDEETEAANETEDDIDGSKKILKTKLMEWDAIKERDMLDDMDRSEKEKLGDLDRIQR